MRTLSWILLLHRECKSAGYDQVQPEHLKCGGTRSLYLDQTSANAIIELECVPQSLKLGIVKPLYKGGS